MSDPVREPTERSAEWVDTALGVHAQIWRSSDPLAAPPREFRWCQMCRLYVRDDDARP
jgi:hypothetical protein